MRAIEIIWTIGSGGWFFALATGAALMLVEGAPHNRAAKLLFLMAPVPLVTAILLWIWIDNPTWRTTFVVCGVIGAFASTATFEFLRWLSVHGERR